MNIKGFHQQNSYIIVYSFTSSTTYTDTSLTLQICTVSNQLPHSPNSFGVKLELVKWYGICPLNQIVLPSFMKVIVANDDQADNSIVTT